MSNKKKALKKRAYDASFLPDMEFEIEIRKIAERLGVFDDFRREIKRLQGTRWLQRAGRVPGDVW